MGQRRTLNQKRLTKKEVRDLIDTEGKLHEEYTDFFEETYVTGFVKRDKVYELSGDRFLYVFDENDSMLPGKGDIYPKDYFLRFVKWNQRVRDNYKNNRASSIDHWRYYSKYGAKILDHIDELVVELSMTLNLDKDKLDRSYKSLDLVSKACEVYGLDNSIEYLYDNLVIYGGEVIKERVYGHWEVNKINYGGDYPYIAVDLPEVQYMAVNVAWSALSGLDEINLRKEAGDEVKRRGPEVQFQKWKHGK
jgi:hypothetical protein